MSNTEIAEQAIRLIERVINNELPTVACPEKMTHVRWKREEVKRIIASKLHVPEQAAIGPKQTKENDKSY